MAQLLAIKRRPLGLSQATRERNSAKPNQAPGARLLSYKVKAGQMLGCSDMFAK